MTAIVTFKFVDWHGVVKLLSDSALYIAWRFSAWFASIRNLKTHSLTFCANQSNWFSASGPPGTHPCFRRINVRLLLITIILKLKRTTVVGQFPQPGSCFLAPAPGHAGAFQGQARHSQMRCYAQKRFMEPPQVKSSAYSRRTLRGTVSSAASCVRLR